MSTGWGYGTTWRNWNIHQTSAVTVGGTLFDKNEASSTTKIGAWQYSFFTFEKGLPQMAAPNY